ncbi:hypothetical protein [Streptomyces sp. DH10]|uniref:hypothetical protein n=1 Tax=Streptomyces sp. DH10 TaxID=3040121 RepID=UPI0024421B41|nr:hypothetical protein [Streptomyces sp. DH10]MDG9709739.1 hypothetical protein [Streptomyces sp. DH10]
MTTRASRSPLLLLVTTLALAVAGVVLLAQSPRPGSASATPPPTAVRPSSTSQETAVRSLRPSKTTPATPSESALPPHGEGASGDQAIQQALEAAWPADLAAEDERQLRAAGRDLLRADATGFGRARWPAFFGRPDQAIAPAFAAARFRIQAVVARRDGAEDRAVVHLVWAGTDRGGTYTDGRITDLSFTRTIKKGEPTWIPQPRT